MTLFSSSFSSLCIFISTGHSVFLRHSNIFSSNHLRPSSSNFGGYSDPTPCPLLCPLYGLLRLHRLYLSHTTTQVQENHLHIPALIILKNTIHLCWKSTLCPSLMKTKGYSDISDDSGLWNEPRFICQAIMETKPKVLIIFGRNYDIPIRHHQLLNMSKHLKFQYS